ncbi:glycine cleavage system transcriptional repressor [Geothermobacter ehrlichii]|uniref:Glycine cleavage system transcriptional repressor n=1 Tax=Geothermobacter ehrlichii TaxID=213224 RepID=A0A5D3WPM4_9BACT|nr:ACT domain-containing protein [Geothermobacter ehrlichii]TYP00157.1 glycine cleavage system transcriptional repressor [Geothermobacter ehrlichii]
MEKRFIMTAFGRDRVGIVADVTRILFENGCNLEETSMNQLADEFALILLFNSRQEDVEALLERETRRLEREKGISAFVRPLSKRSPVAGRGGAAAVVHVEGVDQAGIVYKVSRFLADNGVNIVDLKSNVVASPGSGTTLYLMDIHVQLPEGADSSRLDEGLQRVADELNVDIGLEV